jgi:hypothetical protein
MLRKLIYASAIVVLITGAAGAQSNSSAQSNSGVQSNSDYQSPLSMPFKPKAPPPTQEQIERQKAADKAYDAAMHKIPDRKSSADPWSDVRPASPATIKNKQQ